MSTIGKTLSLIVPIYNDELNIRPFYERAKPVLENLPGVRWEIVFVNDGSVDGSLAAILELRRQDQRVGVLSLSRNFGYHMVIVAGLACRDSDLYGVIHVDCEDPPELLAKFREELERGAPIAYGDRSQRDEAAVIVFCRWLFYWINQRIADAPVRLWLAEFLMFTRIVRDAVLANKSTFPFLRAEIGYVGFQAVPVPYFRERRRLGVSHFNLISLAKFAVGGFLSSSTAPLRMILYLSAWVLAGYGFLLAWWRPTLVEAAAVAAICGFLLLLVTLPVLALYIARIYKDGSARPRYVVDPDKTFLS
jgi:dolichol-phosphate mannosyltransferase